MLTKQPRDYQIEAHDSVYNYFRKKSGNPVIAMPTGTGKALVIAMLLQSIYQQWPTQRILVLTHVKELVAQDHAELKELWPGAPAGIYSAGLNKRETYYPITFAGIASIAKKAHLFGRIDLVIVDEAHMINPTEEGMYKSVFDELRTRNPYLKVIGFTATPYRLGHGRIVDDGIFTDICFDITGMQAFNRLIEEGYLAPLVARPMHTVIDTDGVRLSGGEFVLNQLQQAVNKDEVTEAALRETLEIAHDRKHWLIFASGVEHADNITAMLNDMFGISAVSIHSKLPGGDAERDANIKAFKDGRVRAAVNNNVLTTGFNFPAIDLIVMLRPTLSTVLWVQMLGRGTRPWRGKENCMVLDFARNSAKLGPINDPVVPRKKGQGAGEAPVKECPMCGLYVHATIRLCSCGHEFSFAHKLQQSASTLELVKVDAPITEDFEINHITFSIHRKLGAPEMLKVAYYSGLSKVFYDYVCVEHSGFAKMKAKRWWNERAPEGLTMPDTTRDAIQLSDSLRPPTHIRVWTNKKYPEIIAYCYDGTDFGRKLDDGKQVSIDVHSELPQHQPAPIRAGLTSDLDDDVPF